MYSGPTTYRSGSRVVEVLAGESHSAAWAYVTKGGAEPATYPYLARPDGGRMRRRVHRSPRRGSHRRRELALRLLAPGQ